MANVRDLRTDPEGFLQHLRKQLPLHKISQQELANAALMSRYQVNRIIRGGVQRPHLETLLRLAGALDLLLYGEEL